MGSRVSSSSARREVWWPPSIQSCRRFGGRWVAWGSGDADFDFVDARDSVQEPHCLVAIISGRALADLQRRVGMDGILYVGNDGLEVAGPGRTPALKEARRAQSVIATSCDRLRSRLHDVQGVLVEDKGLTASVH